MPGRDCRQLVPRHAPHIRQRQLVRAVPFVDVGRIDEDRLYTDLTQQVAPPFRSRCQDKLLRPGLVSRH
jgi:hypothetical protein